MMSIDYLFKNVFIIMSPLLLHEKYYRLKHEYFCIMLAVSGFRGARVIVSLLLAFSDTTLVRKGMGYCPITDRWR